MIKNVKRKENVGNMRKIENEEKYNSESFVPVFSQQLVSLVTAWGTTR